MLSVPVLAGGTVRVSRRWLALALLALEIAAFLVHRVPGTTSIAWAARVVLPALAVAILPGLAVTLTALPRRRWSLTELVGIGAGLSFALMQLVLIGAMVFHIGAPVIITIVLGGTALLLAATIWYEPAESGLEAGALELLFWCGVSGLAWFLYAEGAPDPLGEDFLHLGVIRRLEWITRPALDNLYFVPGVVYTYPFPGTHYLMALISRLGDVDPIFTYQKLRFLWGPLAITSVFLAGKQVFGSQAIGIACGLTALVFAAAGAFAYVSPLFWGQLVPFSHASDVAMGVILPLAIVHMTSSLASDQRRDRVFFMVGFFGLTLMLTIVHIREVVQLLVYLGAFLLVGLWVRIPRVLVQRTLLLIVGTVTIATLFTMWHQATVAHIETVVDQQRAALVQLARNASIFELLAPPLPMMSSFVAYYWTGFWGWNPFVLLFIAPLTIAFRRAPLVWMMAGSVFIYLIIMRFPLAAIPYIYLTYFEILFTPIRNVIFFIHVAAGAVILLLAERAAAYSPARTIPLALIICVIVAALWRMPRAFLEFHQDAVILPVLAALGMVFVRARRGWPAQTESTTRRSRAWAVAAALSVALVAAGAIVWISTARPAKSMHVEWRPQVTPVQRSFYEIWFRLANGEYRGATNWSYDLLDDSTRNIRALVTSAAVMGTQDIDRDAFRVQDSASDGDTPTWAGRGLPILGSPLAFTSVLLALIAIAFLGWRRGGRYRPVMEFRSRDDGSVPVRVWGVFGAILFALAAISWSYELSPLVDPKNQNDPARPIESIPCEFREPRPVPYAPPDVTISLPSTSCPATLDLMEWAPTHVPMDAVFAANTLNEFPPSVFLPYQFIGWFGLERNFLNPEELFGDYLKLYHRALATHGAQPFFNNVESAAERRQFVDVLHVTHVLVDPQFHDVLAEVLTGNADFEKQFDNGRWAVYRVRR